MSIYWLVYHLLFVHSCLKILNNENLYFLLRIWPLRYWLMFVSTKYKIRTIFILFVSIFWIFVQNITIWFYGFSLQLYISSLCFKHLSFYLNTQIYYFKHFQNWRLLIYILSWTFRCTKLSLLLKILNTYWYLLFAPSSKWVSSVLFADEISILYFYLKKHKQYIKCNFN